MSQDIVMKNDENMYTNNEKAGNQLQHYCTLAKTAQGTALLETIKQVLEAPNIYVFGELLFMPNVQELNTGDNIKYFNTLNLFAYGTYKQYREKPYDYIELTVAMQKKLQHLTIMSLATQRKCIPYEVLMNELEISNIRHLENTIIEAIYADIIHGKLYQNQRYLEIDNVQGRDVPIGYLPKLGAILNEWANASDLVLSRIRKEIVQSNDVKLQHAFRANKKEQQIMNIKKKLLKTEGNDNDAMQIDSRKSVCSNSEIRKKTGKHIRTSGYSNSTPNY